MTVIQPSGTPTLEQLVQAGNAGITHRPVLGTVADPLSVTITVRDLGVDNAQISVAADDPIAVEMRKPDSVVVIFYRDRFLTSGRLRSVTGDVVPSGQAVFQMRGDSSALDTLNVWPFPATTNGSSFPGYAGDGELVMEDYYTFAAATRYTETAVRSVMDDSLWRTQQVWAGWAETDQQRGGDIRAAGLLPTPRLQTVREVIAPMLEWGKLRLRMGRFWLSEEPDGSVIERVGNGVTAQIVPVGEWRSELSVKGGTVVAGSYTIEGSTATSVLVGGPGDLEQRLFYRMTNKALENEERWRNEVFVDATGIKLEWNASVPEANRQPRYFFNAGWGANQAAVRQQFRNVAEKTLAEGAPKSGISATLSESKGFHFGGRDGVQLGDVVRLDIQGIPFVNRLTECTLSWTPDSFDVKPAVGERKDDTNRQLAKGLRSLADSQRRLVAGR